MKEYRQIKNRLTKEEQAGMARVVEAVRLKRIEATKHNHEDMKNVEGVRQEAGTLGLSKGE